MTINSSVCTYHNISVILLKNASYLAKKRFYRIQTKKVWRIRMLNSYIRTQPRGWWWKSATDNTCSTHGFFFGGISCSIICMLVAVEACFYDIRGRPGKTRRRFPPSEKESTLWLITGWLMLNVTYRYLPRPTQSRSDIALLEKKMQFVSSEVGESRNVWKSVNAYPKTIGAVIRSAPAPICNVSLIK